jgi:Ca2+-binding RTX toxin-like protein
MLIRALIPAACLFALLGGRADAATVAIEDGTAIYTAESGEANRLEIHAPAGEAIVFEDPGAQISAGAGCTPVGPHVASCSSYEDVAVALGDGDDRATLSGHGSGNTTPVLDAGDGNDTLIGGPLRDELDGGRGNDQLQGGDADDRVDGGGGIDVIRGGSPGRRGDILTDGDSDAAPDNDYFEGHDSATISYASRTRSIRAELREDLDGHAGAEGERDVLDGPNGVHGGSGDDVILGTYRDDVLGGGGGDDRLLGSQGTDVLHGGAGRDVLSAGPGSDELVPGEDDARDVSICGSRSDQVGAHDTRDVLRRNCERVAWYGQPISARHFIAVVPAISRRAVAFRAACGVQTGCRGRIELRTPARRLLLGRGRFHVPDGDGGGVIAVGLNARGVRRLERGGRVRVAFVRPFGHSGFTTYMRG